MFAKAFCLCDDTRKEAVTMIEQTTSEIAKFEAQYTYTGENRLFVQLRVQETLLLVCCVLVLCDFFCCVTRSALHSYEDQRG